MSDSRLMEDGSLIHLIPWTTARAQDVQVGGIVPHTEMAVLEVIDAPFDGRPPIHRASFNIVHNIETCMGRLPRHEAMTARILNVTVHSDFAITGHLRFKNTFATRAARADLIRCFQDTYSKKFEERNVFGHCDDPIPGNDIGSISFQWTQELENGDAGLYRLINRTSLQQHPKGRDLRPRDSYLICAQDNEDRMLAIIVHDVSSTQIFNFDKSKNEVTFQNPRVITRRHQNRSWTSLSDGSPETFAKLLVLDFFLSSIYLQEIDYYGDLIDQGLYSATSSEIKNPHLQVPLGLFEPRMSAKHDEVFKEIEDVEGILRSVNNLVDSINWVLGALPQDLVSKSPHQQDGCDLKNLKGLIKERCNNTERTLGAINRQLDYLTKEHAIRESKAIRGLTILAALYLPLSLSASILGMQTPFKLAVHSKTRDEPDLLKTNLLFDFFGVSIVLAICTIFIYYGIRAGMWIKQNGPSMVSQSFRPQSIFLSYGKLWRFSGRWGKMLAWLLIITRWCMVAGLCVVLLATFLTGMLQSGQRAWDIAWPLVSAYVVTNASLVMLYITMYIILLWKTVLRGWVLVIPFRT